MSETEREGEKDVEREDTTIRLKILSQINKVLISYMAKELTQAS